ncbi:restriction endonuclease subunit S [Candidatus Spongiihabitans sp.]|uniref:restriction endonuclease subunit S n=1 Tax=Candidatus Spongiihabitans sp. TaxID=3101308 RepID=UPI003C7D20BF
MSTRTVAISDIAELNRDSLTQQSTPDSIYYLDTGNITKNKINDLHYLEKLNCDYPSRAKRCVQDKSIIYSTVRPNQEHFGFIVEPHKNLIVSTGFTTIDVIDDNVDPLYLYYCLTRKSITDYLHTIGTNSVSAYPSINPGDIGCLVFDLPNNKRDQQKIAAVLSALDTKIELNNRINAELEAMAKTLYDYWFVQFDFPDKNGKPYKTSGGKMVYNETLKRPIPEGWSNGTLWDIANYFNGLPMQKHRPTRGEFLPVIKIKEMNEGYSAKTERACLNIDKNAIVSSGDVLFSWSATLDVKIWSKSNGALNQHIFKVTSNNYPRTFYYFELLNYLKHFKMMADKRKTTMGHITQDHLKQSKICIPPKHLLNKVHTKINPIIEKCLLLEEQIQTLTQLRDWLLPMLMNGQVTVK